MDQELKAKWVKALRSGKYSQGCRELHDERRDTYCCLGVLREVANAKDKVSRYRGGNWLTDKQLRRYGISAETQEALADLNDDAIPFDVIAGVIHEGL